MRAYAICTFDVSRGDPIFERVGVFHCPASQLRTFPGMCYMEAFSAEGSSFEEARVNLFKELEARDRELGWLNLLLRQL